MRMRFSVTPLFVLLCLAALASPGQSRAEDRVVKLATLEWPPFTGAALPGQGESTTIVVRAFQAMGLEARVEFFPWARAVRNARSDPSFAGYFPEYSGGEATGDFLCSDPIGRSPLGFVERADAPVNWTCLASLRGLTIGTVRGYFNTVEFDRMAASGELTAEEVTNDISNVRKVLARRVPLAVIDRNVLHHLLTTDPELAARAGELRFNARQLEDKALYVCFRRDGQGERLVRIFNEGLGRTLSPPE